MKLFDYTRKLWIVFLAVSLIMAACSGGGGGGGSNGGAPAVPGTNTGVFLDSAVEGLDYRTATQTGVTGAGGIFRYAEGETVTFDKVFLLVDGDTVTVGKPLVAGASVKATVLTHGRGDKIIVRKFKRRKRYNKIIRGHRQGFTEIEITGVGK